MTFHDREWYRTGGGGGRSGFFDNPWGWSWRIGRVFDITVRLHLIFIIYIAAELLRAGRGIWTEVQILATLFGIVLLHEFGHCIACRRVGGQADQILMWPLGGLAFTAPPRNPRAHLITTIGGPAVNVLICLAIAIVFIVVGLPVPWNPFSPFSGWSLQDLRMLGNNGLLEAAFYTYYVSFIILLFNLLPIYPLDGGRIVQEVLWFRMGYERSALISTQTGMIGAIGLGLWGIASGQFMMIGIAIFGFITCWQQRQVLRMSGGFMTEEREPWARGYDFSKGYGGMPGDDAPAPAKRVGWFGRRGKGGWEKLQEEIRREQAEVDRILAKVSREGINSLSRKEKRTLQRATERQRERDRELGRVDKL